MPPPARPETKPSRSSLSLALLCPGYPSLPPPAGIGPSLASCLIPSRIWLLSTGPRIPRHPCFPLNIDSPFAVPTVLMRQMRGIRGSTVSRPKELPQASVRANFTRYVRLLPGHAMDRNYGRLTRTGKLCRKFVYTLERRWYKIVGSSEDAFETEGSYF